MGARLEDLVRRHVKSALEEIQRSSPEQKETASAEFKAIASTQLDVSSDLIERITVLETDSKHFATKADLANAKVWATTSILGAAASALMALVVVILRLLGS